jgi:hypothetical protein
MQNFLTGLVGVDEFDQFADAGEEGEFGIGGNQVFYQGYPLSNI